ncbi:hypothetical protein XvhCFBP2543_09025 [Xanthomonas vasicola]|nr:hypothetical protein NX04_21325 [Xanthomonas vasicola]RNK75449.1 hypothetical protein C9390_14940 [Xanthomonas vasicola pv. vasculorum]KGR45621.1 hypothetical protein NX05_07010 [Xanthomonas vasicola]KGR58552.1 hypothetical protein NX79_18790 [Xanthomonas vasicola]PPV02880.1 hypothetical protein XvhCFBP2543_09025 [Xanthomonas vasicola]
MSELMVTAAVAAKHVRVTVFQDRNVRVLEVRVAGVIITAQETATAQRNDQLRVMFRAHEVTHPSRSR